MNCSPVSSATSSCPDGLAWMVTVECSDGSTHDVKVLVGEASLAAPSEATADIRRSEGKSAVLAALTADPTRIPTRITCSTEGCQPEYAD